MPVTYSPHTNMARIQKLNAVIGDALKEFGLEKKARSYAVITNWAEIVGEKVAEITTPMKLEKGVLTVQVQSPVWKYELTMRKQEILNKIAAKHGPYEVKEIIWK
jgi:predicted nucleic acid-binding Zn ribbon protein